ncbi:DNA polymerase Y family protein [Pseudobutyrivibrio xylanivorans]|uniref:DNA polymerase IV n=1 Tax=Pseudobutyrivibrio xylanivorans TaxID=185007 RepID=A0A5P6VP93_PSEXY|nr:DNA polymerase IV [Pseudobutyrivibrio xylanivorans]QFJ54495.1 DNA polymerase IV [Pseudobutyrivibrio xylanivorans]
MSDCLIFHIDVNSAFVSWSAVEQLHNGGPDLREIPSIVGGDPNSRTGIVAAKSIPAKKYGITTGEPVSMALRKCPNLVIARSNFDWYVKCSRAFKAICQEYTPTMQSFSIDEVFLDMSGMHLIYPDPIKTAYEIKDRIKNELGFTVNVGIAENKLCAKMASDFEKPDKVHTLFPDEIAKKMWPLPVGELFTCGKASAARLNSYNIKTIGALANTSLEQLMLIFSERGAIHFHNYANGIDDSPVIDEPEDAKGYSAETTVEDDLVDLESINRILLAQADIVAARMRADEGKCRCVGVTFRNLDFVNKSHQKKLPDSTDVTDVIFKTAKELIRESWHGEPLRLIGLSLTDIDRDGFEQLSLFEDTDKEKRKALDSTLDLIRGKFGNAAIQRASTIDTSGRINRKFKAEQNNDIENNKGHL